MTNEQMLTEFINAIGQEYVITDDSELRLASTTNYLTQQQIILILRPADSIELQHCVKIANHYKQPIYVVSTGKNWGYGSRVPVTDNSILIELNRLNRIIDYNEKLGYITVEPGVTFNQAFHFLREQRSELIISVTGGSVDSSMIGNALERGIGTGLYAERFSFICGLEVILPNGELISTGFERYGDTLTAKLYRYGIGPYIDGIFSQSNFGIVTKMTIWLMHAPKYFNVIFYKVESEERLSSLIDELRELSTEGLVRPALTIYNDTRVISTIIQFPFHQVQPGSVDADVLMNDIRKSSSLGALIGSWNGEITVRSSSEEHATLQIKLIKERISSFVNDFQVVSVTKSEIMSTLEREHSPAHAQQKEQPTIQSFLLNKYLGIPSNAAIKQTYWRKQSLASAQMDPDKDKCGLIWVSPVVPFVGEEVLKAINTIKVCIKKYGFEPAISLQCLSERCINMITSFAWDRDIQGEDEKAEQCYMELNTLLHAQAYFSYRSTTLMMQSEALEKDNLAPFLNELKHAVDPNNILAPGRYVDF